MPPTPEILRLGVWRFAGFTLCICGSGLGAWSFRKFRNLQNLNCCIGVAVWIKVGSHLVNLEGSWCHGKVPGGPGGSPQVPGRSRGGPWGSMEVPGGPWVSLGGAWGVPGGSLEGPGGVSGGQDGSKMTLLTQLGANLGQLGANLGQLGANLEPSWGQLGAKWVKIEAKRPPKWVQNRLIID